jgi:Flp pilus assembly protein TadD
MKSSSSPAIRPRALQRAQPKSPRPGLAEARAVASTIAEARGYQRGDLYAIAEIAYHYLMSGGTGLAVALFEGLCAISPKEAYFALGLGLALDHDGQKRSAFDSYTRAAELDPMDGRPDVNRAELLIESGDRAGARRLLSSGALKARRRRDEALERKAQAILAHLSPARSTDGRHAHR